MKKSTSRRPKGAGSITSRGEGKWLISVCVGNKADGSQRRVTKTIEGSKSEAEFELVKLKAKMGKSPHYGDTMTLDEYYYGPFLSSRTGLLVDQTLRTYESVYKLHIHPEFGSIPANEINRALVQRWVLHLPSAALAQKCYRHLRAILRAMWIDGLLDEKPLERPVRLPRHTVAPKDPWSFEETLEALEALRGHQLEALVLAMAGAGLRREEALAIDIPDDLSFTDVLDMQGNRRTYCHCLIKKTWTDGTEQQDNTKTYNARPVSIGDPFASRLQEIVSDGRPKLLMNLKGTAPIQPSSVPETWKRAFREGQPLYGMRFMEIRLLRHFHETLVAKAGLSDAVNAKLHGHSSEVMYSNYLSITQTEADEAASRIANLFRSAL